LEGARGFFILRDEKIKLVPPKELLLHGVVFITPKEYMTGVRAEKILRELMQHINLHTFNLIGMLDDIFFGTSRRIIRL
jgi:hypothetical protein